MSPGQQQQSPTPAPPSQSWLPSGVSTQLGPRGVLSLSPAPPPHPDAAPLGTTHTFTSSLALRFKPRQFGTDKPTKPNPVFKCSVLPARKQPQSIGAAVCWAYAPLGTESGRRGARRRLKMAGGWRTSRSINTNACSHPSVDSGTQTLMGLQGPFSKQLPLSARPQVGWRNPSSRSGL